MSPPQELDYIGLSDASSAVVDGGGGDGGGGSAATRAALNLKETELRLGPPGSESPDRSDGRTPLTLTLDLLPPKSGAKRGFSLASGSDAAAGGAPAGAAAAAPKTAPAPPKSQIPSARADPGIAPAAKAQVVGWPPIRSYRKNTMAAEPVKKEEAEPEVKQGAQVVGWPPIRSFRKNTMATNPVKKEEAEVKQGAGCLYVKVSMDGAPYLRKVDLKTHCNYKELSMALEKMFSGFTIGQCGGQGVPGRDGVNEIRLMDLLSGSEYVLTYEDKDGDWMLVGDVPWEMFSGSCRRLRIMKGSDAIGLAPRVMEKCKNRK